MKKIHIPDLGVIEGFFGRSWVWQDRIDYANFLAGSGYQFYIYAPKDDSYLRKNWQQDWPASNFEKIRELRDACHGQGIAFGIGLSPYEIYLNPNHHQRAALIRKLQHINQLQPDILCLLFDDMRGDFPELARIQCELVQLACEFSQAKRIIFCPTYYSFDPVLEKVFGPRPHAYWQTLGSNLDPQVEIFWTGPKVCSSDYPVSHLREVSDLLARKPFLWDNYPVNDGALKAGHLHLRAFGEDRGQIADLIAGHAVNPMNEAWLSRIPLLSLPRAYRERENYNPHEAFVDACHAVCSPALAKALMEDLGLFQDSGLEQLDNQQRHQLLGRYQTWAPQEPCAREVCDWLTGQYVFDPACLTG